MAWNEVDKWDGIGSVSEILKGKLENASAAIDNLINVSKEIVQDQKTLAENNPIRCAYRMLPT